MGLIESLFGGGKRRVNEKQFQEIISKQTAMAPQTLDVLRSHGVTEKTELQLEFFFYTDKQTKAVSLHQALEGLNYKVTTDRSAAGDGQLAIIGWTVKMPMDEQTVVSWTARMCELGFEHDCEFDGWGTYPGQSEV
jgi:hypothetical protein